MKEISSEVEIDASPDKVWQTLIETPGFLPDEIRQAARDGKVGTQLKVRIATKGGRGETFTVKLLKVDAPREVRWKGRLWISGLFDGEHSFEISSQAGRPGATFVQRERFSGLFLPFLSKTVRDTRKEFDDMGRSLKSKAEELATPSPS